MNYIGNFFGCCQRDKSYNKTDIEIEKIKTLNEISPTLLSSDKNTLNNPNANNSLLNNLPTSVFPRGSLWFQNRLMWDLQNPVVFRKA